MRKCSLAALDSVFAAIASASALYLPVDGSDGRAVYTKWEDGVKWSQALNTVRSPKDFFFPQTENLMEFKTSGKSIEILDIVFNNTVYDIGFIYDIGGVYSSLTAISKSHSVGAISSTINKCKTKITTDIESIVEGYK